MEYSHSVLSDSEHYSPPSPAARAFSLNSPGSWYREVRCGEGTDVAFVVSYAQERMADPTWTVSPVKLPEEWWQMWVGYTYSLRGYNRVSFAAYRYTQKSSAFVFQVEGVAEPRPEIIRKRFEVGADGVKVDEVIHFSGDVLIRICPVADSPFVFHSFKVEKLRKTNWNWPWNWPSLRRFWMRLESLWRYYFGLR